jgi:hypothetical protein
MSTKKKSTKGGLAKPAQGKGKNGQARPKGYGKKFTGDFGDQTPIRARGSHPRILALKTYGGLRAFLTKALGQGKSFETIGKGLQVSGSRISEFVAILGIERPKKGKAPAAPANGELKIKKLPNGDVLEAVNGHAAKVMKG